MGVPGLWDIVRPAAQRRALTHLAVVDGFERNPGGARGLRVGIDASIWFYHATYGREGENPELRTLFFRCARLMNKPFLPLFVFDGPKRPKMKRKKKVSGKNHWLISGMQEIIEAFGFEWRMAPGEAEAELAYLNRAEIIDAIITDDVDTLVFGATMVIRNPGKMLSGNVAHPVRATENDDGEHTYVYSSVGIRSHEDVGLTQGGLILMALLCGGDYDSVGLQNCGTNVAYGLARCGFGDSLLDAAKNFPREALSEFLSQWRVSLCAELRTNSSGYLPSKKIALAKSLPDSFPDIEVLLLYTHPVTSERAGRTPSSTEYLWAREPDLGKLAALCERKFEWGVATTIIKRFRTVIWSPMVLRILRRAVLDADTDGPSTPRRRTRPGIEVTGTPSKMITKHFSSLSNEDSDNESEQNHRLIVKIHSKREHSSTDGVPEYRLEIAPSQLVRLAEAGIQGVRPPAPTPAGISDSGDDEETCVDDDDDESGKKKRENVTRIPVEPNSHLRIWMPASLVSRVEPALVRAFEDQEERKRRLKESKTQRKAERAIAKDGSTTTDKPMHTSRSRSKRTVFETADEEEELSAEDFSHAFGLDKHKSRKGKSDANRKTARLAKNTRPKDQVGIFEEEEEEESDNVSDTGQSNLRIKSLETRTRQCSADPDDESRKASSGDNPRIQGSSAGLTELKLLKAPGRSVLLDLLNDSQPIASSSRSTEVCKSVPSPASADENHQLSRTPFPLYMSDSDDEAESRTISQMTPQSDRERPVLFAKGPLSENSGSSDKLHAGHKSNPRSSRASRSSNSIVEIMSESEQGTPKAVVEARRNVRPLVAARARGRRDAKPVISSGRHMEEEEEECNLSLSDHENATESRSPSTTRQESRTERALRAGPSTKSSSQPAQTIFAGSSRAINEHDAIVRTGSQPLRLPEDLQTGRHRGDALAIIDLSSSDSEREIDASWREGLGNRASSVGPKDSRLESGRDMGTATKTKTRTKTRLDSIFPSVKPFSRHSNQPWEKDASAVGEGPAPHSTVPLPEVIDLT